MKLTVRGLDALKPKPTRYELWEDGRTGLGVRVSPAGRKSWVFMYRFDGKARRMGLGTYPTVGLASARVRHAKAKELLTKGTDPGAQQTERKQAERTAETVNDLAQAPTFQASTMGRRPGRRWRVAALPPLRRRPEPGRLGLCRSLCPSGLGR